MNRALVAPIANAVLYEGYILYPYRPALKNRQRWIFGGLYPEAYCQLHHGEAASNQTECLVHGGMATTFEAAMRFLHLTARTARELLAPAAEWPGGAEPPSRPVAALRVGATVYHTWQEAEEREVPLAPVTLGELCSGPVTSRFQFPGRRHVEPVTGPDGPVGGLLERAQQELRGEIEVCAVPVGAELFRVTVRVRNCTPLDPGATRDDALLRALVSAHILLGVDAGAFVSLLDPDAAARPAAAACRNVGLWPVLVGAAGQRDTMLASPIILYDYPQVAPESPGDFFDGAEIDEMLALRIATLTDGEKAEMAAVDGRTRDLLARTEALAREQLLGLHGTVRGLRPVP